MKYEVRSLEKGSSLWAWEGEYPTREMANKEVASLKRMGKRAKIIEKGLV